MYYTIPLSVTNDAIWGLKVYYYMDGFLNFLHIYQDFFTENTETQFENFPKTQFKTPKTQKYEISRYLLIL